MISDVMKKTGCDKDKAFSSTLKSGPAEYARQLKDIVKSCNDKSFKTNHLVFLDKNHPMDAIHKLITEISSNLPFNVQGKFMYLVPAVKSRVLELPFSSQFLLQAFSRC